MNINSDHSKQSGQFPFEAFIRQRYHAVRSRKIYDLSSIFQLAILILILSLVTLVLITVIAVLTFILFISPIVILLSAISRQFSKQDESLEGNYSPYSERQDYEHHTIIDIEPERK